MKVYILNNGFIETDRNNLVANTTVGTVDEPIVKNIWTKSPMRAFLIKHPTFGKILFDTGSHPEAMEGRWPESITDIFPYKFEEENKLVNQLALCDTKPEDIDTVIISHMHMDHIGNLDLFTHADVYVPKADFMYGQTLVRANPDPSTHGAYVKEELDLVVKEYHLIDEDFELCEGIEVINLPGHTPGLLGLVLHLEKEGTVILPQDSVYTSENYGPPAHPSGLVYDGISYFESIEKVRKLQEKYNAEVIFGHDIDLFETLKEAPEYYE